MLRIAMLGETIPRLIRVALLLGLAAAGLGGTAPAQGQVNQQTGQPQPTPTRPDAPPPAPAQAPGTGSNAASDRGVHQNPQRAPADEGQLLRVLGDDRVPDRNIDGWTYTLNGELRHIVQPFGRTWRDFRVGASRWTHGLLIAVALGAIGLFIAVIGPLTYERDAQGRRILRFRAVSRFVHWTTAVSFVLLALTGLNMVFGRLVLQPFLGDPLYHQVAQGALIVHNNVGFPFLLGIVLMGALWMRDNVFHRVDWEWIRRGGGYLSGEHPVAEKFNAGQKAIYWFSLLGGLLIGVSGILLLLPIANLGVNGMQLLHGAHTLVAAFFIAMIIGHIYLGSAGVRGSFSAMSRGTVDLNWARTHHPLWVEASIGRDEPPPGTVVVPAELRR